jgi:hypothetical protein
MAMMTVHCSVSHADVVTVADFEGATLRVVCGNYDAPSRICKLKMRAREGGPLSRLLERVDEGTLGSRGARCDFA